MVLACFLMYLSSILPTYIDNQSNFPIDPNRLWALVQLLRSHRHSLIQGFLSVLREGLISGYQGIMFTSKDQSNGSFSRIAIALLTDKNFGSWIINIRAELRTKKLWKDTQGVYESEGTPGTNTTGTGTEEGNTETSPQLSTKERKAMKEWEEKSQETAGLIILTISPGVQQKPTEADFNDGYFMLTSLRIH